MSSDQVNLQASHIGRQDHPIRRLSPTGLGFDAAEAVPMLATEVEVLKLTARQREVLSLLAHRKSN